MKKSEFAALKAAYTGLQEYLKTHGLTEHQNSALEYIFEDPAEQEPRKNTLPTYERIGEWYGVSPEQAKTDVRDGLKVLKDTLSSMARSIPAVFPANQKLESGKAVAQER